MYVWDGQKQRPHSHFNNPSNHPTIPSTHTPLSVLYPSHFHSHKGKNGHCGVRYIPHQASSGDGWLDVFWVGGRWLRKKKEAFMWTNLCQMSFALKHFRMKRTVSSVECTIGKKRDTRDLLSLWLFGWRLYILSADVLRKRRRISIEIWIPKLDIRFPLFCENSV